MCFLHRSLIVISFLWAIEVSCTVELDCWPSLFRELKTCIFWGNFLSHWYNIWRTVRDLCWLICIAQWFIVYRNDKKCIALFEHKTTILSFCTLSRMVGSLAHKIVRRAWTCLRTHHQWVLVEEEECIQADHCYCLIHHCCY